jgi:hypothetical protein
LENTPPPTPGGGKYNSQYLSGAGAGNEKGRRATENFERKKVGRRKIVIISYGKTNAKRGDMIFGQIYRPQHTRVT